MFKILEYVKIYSRIYNIKNSIILCNAMYSILHLNSKICTPCKKF